MTSSEKILAGIIDEAKAKADEIIAEANKNAEQLLKEAEISFKAEEDKILADASQKAKLIKTTGKSSAELLKRDRALTFRRESIEKVLDYVKIEINSYGDNEYFSYLTRLISKSVLPMKGELLLNSHDLNRDTTSFKTELAGYNLTLCETPADIDGGFILKYNDIQINGELKALIREKRELLVDNINNLLFG